ncbi:leucine-rich repeat-containing protein 63 isoform X2 [Octopus bimaculoides]|uniref:leucine-rich repeat-containing protein 63 isoform X2 n=1 Tax=Octopus bimaculoides TaxID=37653 RepID=UPI00071C3D13|nr:leucine-rich repeat-containing protein 63 isoform X2 [Octopus bimaculoides]|eukprot:XP_014773006.1 PREDICTED: leucine-rich repeat-containing protein 63-like isoform X2 [Octopus bimaculoides]
MGKILLRRPRLSTRTPLIVFMKKQAVETNEKELSISGGKSSKQHNFYSSESEADDKKQSQHSTKSTFQSSDSSSGDKTQSPPLNKSLSHPSDSDWDDKIQNHLVRRLHPSLASGSETGDDVQYQQVAIKEAKLVLNEFVGNNKKELREYSSSEASNSRQLPTPCSRRLTSKKSTLAKLHEEESEIFEAVAPGVNALILQTSKMSHVPVEKAQSIVYSRKTYTEITQLLAEKFMTNSLYRDKLKTIRIPTEDLGEYRRRVPQRQLIIEVAAILKEHIKETMNINVQTVIQSVPKYQFSSKGKPSTEIVLYRQAENEAKKCEKSSTDGYISAGEVKYFQGSVRTPTPFTGPYENLVFPEDLSLLDCMLCGGKFLNLKAHFICTLSNINYLRDTLTSINLSFNHFTTLPDTLLEMRNLEILKLRDNPLCNIPPGIKKLRGHLHTLILSFCLLSELPSEFSLLTELKHLDLSYNLFSSLPDEFSNLRSLEELSVEGNKLSMLPSGLLQLDLQSFNASNNFLHPIFWPETIKAFKEDFKKSAFSYLRLLR